MIAITYEDYEGCEVTTEFPSKEVPCSRCPDGTVDCFEGGVTSEMREDPDFDEDYHNGKFSVPCPECKGTRKVLEVDEAALSPEQAEQWKDCQSWQRLMAEIAAEERRERRQLGG